MEQEAEEEQHIDIDQDYRVISTKVVQASGMPIAQSYSKEQKITFPTLSTFKIYKPIKTSKSVMDYLSTETERHIAIDGGWFYILKEQSKDKFIVSSVTSLARLLKILKTHDSVNIRLIFTEKKLKRFRLAEQSQEKMFFLKLRNEALKHGLDFGY